MHHNVVEFCGEETNSSFILCSVLWILAEGLSEGHKAFKSDFSLGWTGHGDVLFERSQVCLYSANCWSANSQSYSEPCPNVAGKILVSFNVRSLSHIPHRSFILDLPAIKIQVSTLK